MRHAPLEPSTAVLQTAYGINTKEQLAVLAECDSIAEALNNHDEHLVALIGACAMTGDAQQIAGENQLIAKKESDSDEQLVAVPV